MGALEYPNHDETNEQGSVEEDVLAQEYLQQMDLLGQEAELTYDQIAQEVQLDQPPSADDFTVEDMQTTESAERQQYKEYFVKLINDYPRINSIEEWKAVLKRITQAVTKKTDVTGKEITKTTLAFQQYLNYVGKIIAGRFSPSHRKRLRYGYTQPPKRADILSGKATLITENGIVGGATTRLIANIRTCLYLKRYGESLFARESRETLAQGFESVKELLIVQSVPALKAYIKKLGKTEKQFQEYLNTQAAQYGLSRISVTDSISSGDVQLLQDIRTQYTLDKISDYESRSRGKREAKRNLQDEHTYIEPGIVVRDPFERQIKQIRIDRGDVVRRIGRGEIPNISDKTKQDLRELGLKALLTESGRDKVRQILVKDRALMSRMKNKYMTYCIRSMRENFTLLGINIRADYPVGREYDPKFREEIVKNTMISQDAKQQLAYFSTRPEYFKGYPLKDIPENRLDAYCNYIEAQVYELAQKNKGTAFPILRDRTNLGHGSIGFVTKDGEVRAADSYYMPDSREGPLRDLIKAVWKKMQTSASPEGIIGLPTFMYEKDPEVYQKREAEKKNRP